MGAIHIIPGLSDPTCGIAVAAKQLVARGVGEDGEVWVHSMWSPMVIKECFKALLTGKKLVRMPHGCTDPEKLRYHWHKKRWVAPIERWLFRHVDRIVATCEDEVEWIKKFEPAVKRVEIVRLDNRVEHKDRMDSEGGVFNAEPQSRREGDSDAEHLHDSKQPTRLLYVGRLHPLKGVEYLLEAMPTNCELVIIGKDEGEGNKLKKIAERRGLDVEFRGVVSEAEKESAYQWCDVLVLPTLSENFGLVVAEALERGKRVITTDGAPAWGDGNDYGGRLVYLKGFRDGADETRVSLLRDAIEQLIKRRNHV